MNERRETESVQEATQIATASVTSAADGTAVCERCEIAETPWRRLRGLMGRAALAPGAGLLIRPTFSIHTMFMRFPIDVAFLDAEMRVIAVRPELRPWRAASARGSRAVLELPAGEIARRGIEVGQRLELEGYSRPDRSPGFAELSGAYRSGGIAAAALLAAVAIVRFGLGAEGLVAAAFAAVLAILAAIDLQHRVLPNRIVLPAAVAMLAAQTILHGNGGEWLAAGALAAGLMLLPAMLRPGSLGMGDVKLALLMGFGLGWDIVTALMVGSLLAVPVALAILARGGVAARRQAIPYGPFLAGGAVFALLTVS